MRIEQSLFRAVAEKSGCRFSNNITPVGLDVKGGGVVYVGLMHTLFTLEDNYGLKVTEQDGELALQVDFRKNKDAARCMRCSGPGGNRRPNWKPVRSLRRTMTAGVTTIRSTTEPFPKK